MTRPTRGGARTRAGRPALPEGERRSVRLVCWVTPAERAACEAAAQANEQTRSDWVRDAIAKAIDAGGPDVAQAF